jgi:hypothetical protein
MKNKFEYTKNMRNGVFGENTFGFSGLFSTPCDLSFQGIILFLIIDDR